MDIVHNVEQNSENLVDNSLQASYKLLINPSMLINTFGKIIKNNTI